MCPLPPRQQAVYDFIRTFVRANGYPPSLRDIGHKLGINSTNGVMCHMRALEKKGYIRRPTRRARAIQVVDPPPEAA